jgi:hypothetical protein
VVVDRFVLNNSDLWTADFDDMSEPVGTVDHFWLNPLGAVGTLSGGFLEVKLFHRVKWLQSVVPGPRHTRRLAKTWGGGGWEGLLKDGAVRMLISSRIAQ